VNIPTEIGATEAEEIGVQLLSEPMYAVHKETTILAGTLLNALYMCFLFVAGVEHLLRDVKDATVSTLAAEVSTLAAGLSGLKSRLLQIQEYLSLVINGKLPVNHDILYQLQVEPLLPA